jgi:hypothetical protein
LPLDSQLDYGATYEEIRRNYSKGGNEGKQTNWSQADDDYAISQMSDYSMANVLAALDFLEPLFSEEMDWSADEEKLKRALIAVLSLYSQIKALLKGSSATTGDKETITIGRVGLLLGMTCGKWPDAQSLKASIISMDRLEAIVAYFIGCEQRELADLDANKLRCRIITNGTA